MTLLRNHKLFIPIKLHPVNIFSYSGLLQKRFFGHKFPSLANFRLAEHLYCYMNSFKKGPVYKKEEIVGRTTSLMLEEHLGERNVIQTFHRYFYQKLSFEKNVVVDILNKNPKTTDLLSTKVCIENPNELVDLRFIPELLTAAQFAKVQPSVLEIKMNSENRRGMEGRVFDVEVTLDKKKFYLDHKGGNNMQKIANHVLGEICYTHDNQLYSVLNAPTFDLDTIQGKRIEFLSENDTYKKEIELIEKIKLINAMTDINEGIKNIQIQEELLHWMSKHSDIHTSLSFFISRSLIDNPTPLPHKFATDTISLFDKHQNIFLNKQATEAFLIDYLKLYRDTDPEIIHNILKSEKILVQLGLGNVIEELKKIA